MVVRIFFFLVRSSSSLIRLFVSFWPFYFHFFLLRLLPSYIIDRTAAIFISITISRVFWRRCPKEAASQGILFWQSYLYCIWIGITHVAVHPLRARAQSHALSRVFCPGPLRSTTAHAVSCSVLTQGSTVVNDVRLWSHLEEIVFDYSQIALFNAFNFCPSLHLFVTF